MTNNLRLIEQDEEINKLTSQIAKKKMMITQKIKELRNSKKDNPLLEGIYNEHVNYIKLTNRATTSALTALQLYLSELDVPEEDLNEKEKDIRRIKQELKKHKR
jgi:hypothetical protein